MEIQDQAGPPGGEVRATSRPHLPWPWLTWMVHFLQHRGDLLYLSLNLAYVWGWKETGENWGGASNKAPGWGAAEPCPWGAWQH